MHSDPFTDDSRPPGTQSRSLSSATGLGRGLGSGLGIGLRGNSQDSHQAVVGLRTTPAPEYDGGEPPEYYRQHQPSTDQLLHPSHPPPQWSPAGTTRSRSPQSLPPVQTQFPPRPPSSLLEPGAVAYLQYADQTTDHSLPSPGPDSPGAAEDHRLTSAFSVASELSPQYTAPFPPLKTDETWRHTPDPIKASSSYRHSYDRRQSFTPSFSGELSGFGDNAVITPLDSPMQGPVSEDMLSPYSIRGGSFSSHPSPITELAAIIAHSQDGSNDSGTWISTRSMDTSASSPVVMRAERVQLTPMTLSLKLPSHTVSPGLSSGSQYEESVHSTEATSRLPQPPPPPLPPLPPLPHIQPLSIGKKRSHQN